MRMTKNILILSLLLLFLAKNNASKFKFTNVGCESFNQSLVVINTCRLKAINRDKTVINIELSLKEMVNRVMINGQMFKRENGYKPWLYNITTEGCQFYRRANDPVIKLIFNLFKSYSSLNHTCPYSPGTMRLWGFYLLPQSVPVPLPSGDYLVAVKWSIHNFLQLSTNVSFSFQEDFLN
ncbi:uncharacterized protein Dwil_GK13829 [Drosophila willistoni]|uniref:MD-2-related lipid-recognition domain-containing protein n=1 Tax=Drosophila willistoni TaxID=7260 RepID=B4NJ50_DROWI|nr:uncharacterized protein Dwil_GK13829 [Drosophila willistoni]